MQLVNRGDHPPVAQFRMLPIMDLNPGDRSCILSTLSRVIEQAKKVNVKSLCITFDQPLWLKAVEVTVAQSLIIRLDGFHTLMSFLGSIGLVMAGSGLLEVLENCYGENTVGHMMGGKAYDWAVLGTAAILLSHLEATATERKMAAKHRFAIDHLSNVKNSKPVKLFKFIRNCINIAIIFVCNTFAMCLSSFVHILVIFMTIIDRRRHFPAVCGVYA